MAEIRTLITPAKLYRYRAVRDARTLAQEMAAIEEGYLWCSEFRRMNDPMEGLYEADQAFRRDPQYRDLREEIFYSKLNIGICSLSESATNELMWAHYADQFGGLCVEYDLPALLGRFPMTSTWCGSTTMTGCRGSRSTASIGTGSVATK